MELAAYVCSVAYKESGLWECLGKKTSADNTLYHVGGIFCFIIKSIRSDHALRYFIFQ